jgi:hypothetical protein
MWVFFLAQKEGLKDQWLDWSNYPWLGELRWLAGWWNAATSRRLRGLAGCANACRFWSISSADMNLGI